MKNILKIYKKKKDKYGIELQKNLKKIDFFQK